MGVKKLIPLGALFFLVGCALSHPTLSNPKLKPQLLTADYILVGERHLNPCDHKFEELVLKQLLHLGLKPVVGLEMVPEPYQGVLNRFSQHKITLAQLPKQLQWNKNWGYPFKFYQPIFRLARQHQLPLVALNIPSKIVKKWAAQKALTPSEQKLLPSRIILPPQQQKNFLQSLFKRHLFFLSNISIKLNTFLRAQSLWESKMAERAVWAYHHFTQKPVLIFIGAGHIEDDFGLITRLKTFQPEAKIFSFIPGPKEAIQANICSYKCPDISMPPRFHLGLKLIPVKNGLKIDKILPESKAAKAGLKPGDLILKINQTKLSSLMDAHKLAIQSLKHKKPLTFLIKRHNKLLSIRIYF
ncbi:MAG: ChaN family lipoprotein [Desulfonauticus sp.]|nr:ChaN family lipoprotein [Desulfonauticus sp.]